MSALFLLFKGISVNSRCKEAQKQQEVEALAPTQEAVESLLAELFSLRTADSNYAYSLARLVYKYAKDNALPPELVAAIILIESETDSMAVSSKGAIGLMQILPEYWEGVYPVCGTKIFEIRVNICYGTRIFKYFLNLENGNIVRALRRYNGSGTTYTQRVLAVVGTLHLMHSNIVRDENYNFNE